jgi:hypothetical protein
VVYGIRSRMGDAKGGELHGLRSDPNVKVG